MTAVAASNLIVKTLSYSIPLSLIVSKGLVI